ncbi:hypothetical protein TWF102_005894 [Orbilia oligospora]|uniref:Uncharacterized protein n=1 Tax=Orbilia oligospora TaxID=2813651 RepID=A0A7C8JKZ6_ORBOL|nr:hypothetical protein TWF102_005894 [Orbilia oligospora]KAF3108108.1 hypothetical protein TWF103_005666 [Orbilia oligospora]
MSSSDDKLPTSTLARSFSAQLNDIFLLDEVLLTKEKEVDQKKLQLTQQNAELDALEARLKAAEALLAKQNKRMSLISDSAPTPANTEVGNPLSPGSSTRRRNPIPLFQDPSADTEAGVDRAQDIADGSTPEPPKKDDPVALQAPRALPVLSREIEAREEEEERKSNQEERWGGGWGGGGGRLEGPGSYDGGNDRDDIGAPSNTSLFTSTFANPDVPKKDKIQFTSLLEKGLPKLSEGQGQFFAQADAAQHQQQYQTTLPTASQDEYMYGNRTFEPENAETLASEEPRNSGAPSATSASINGQNLPITVKPDEDGDEVATGDLIDQYGYYDSEPEPEEEELGLQNSSASIGNTHATQPIVPTPHVSQTAVSVTRPNRSDSLASPVRYSSTVGSAVGSVGQTPNTQESTSTKYIVDDGFFTRPRRAPTVTESELPPLPGQTPDIPKRKPVRGSEDSSRPEISLLTTDRPPTPPSKAPRSIVNPIPYDYNTSHLSVATNYTDSRTIPSMSSTDSTHGEKPLPPTSPSEPTLDVPARESVTERGFGGLLKMKKSLQGLRKKAQAASSPISPTGDQRSFSTGALGHYPSSDPRPKDEPPLPPIPPEKLNAATPVPAIPVQYRASPPPQTPQTPSQYMPPPAPQSDLFDRIQASLPNQQQEESSPRRFEAKHKKAVEAIAKFSGKMSALRALRKKEAKEDSPPPPPPLQSSQEPPLADWEIEQRTNAKQNPYGHPISPPQTASLNAAPQNTYPIAAQTWKSQSSMYSINGYVNGQTPISPPQEPLSDDAFPVAPAKLTEEAPPPTPAKYELPLPRRLESISMDPPGTPEKPDPTFSVEKSSPERPKTSSSRGLSIFPSSSTTKPSVSIEMAPPAPPKELELPPPPPQKSQTFVPTPFKPLALELSASSSLSVEKPQPSPGLAPPASPGFAPGRGGRTETYSFLGDYYFGDNQDGDDQAGQLANSSSLQQHQQAPPERDAVKGPPNIKRNESGDKLNFRIQSFTPFTLGDDFSSGFSFDDTRPTPPMADPKSAPNQISTPIPPPTSAPPSTALPDIPVAPAKAERRSPAIPESIPEHTRAPTSLPEVPKTVQRVPSKPELRDKHPTPLQTVAHRSILSSSMPTGRESSGSPSLPMKDIPEEGPYPSTKSPLSTTSASGPAPNSTTPVPQANKAGYASGVSSVRSSSGYTESPSATSSRTSLSSGTNGPTNGVATPTSRIPSGEQGPYPARNSSSQGHPQRPPSQETVVDRRIQSGVPNMPPSARAHNNMHLSGPPHGMPPQGMPPRGRMPGPPPPGATPELRGRPGFRPPPGGGPMGPGYPPRSASPAFSERSMRPPRGPPPPRSASPAFSERRGPPPPRSSSPAFSMRGDPRMRGPPPPPHHGRKRSNSMEILDFAVDFELPGSALRFEAKEADASRRARSESQGFGGRGPPPGSFRGRAESPGPREGFRSGSRAGSRGPPGVPPHMNGAGSRPGSRTQSPFRHPPVSHNFNGMPPRGPPGSRRNSGGSSAGGGRRPSMSEAELDIALGVGQIPGMERKYRPPPQMRGGRPPPGPMPPHMPQGGGGGRGLKSLNSNGSGVTYPGLDDGFGMMDGGGRMPTPAMPRREEMA